MLIVTLFRMGMAISFLCCVVVACIYTECMCVCVRES